MKKPDPKRIARNTIRTLNKEIKKLIDERDARKSLHDLRGEIVLLMERRESLEREQGFYAALSDLVDVRKEVEVLAKQRDELERECSTNLYLRGIAADIDSVKLALLGSNLPRDLRGALDSKFPFEVLKELRGAKFKGPNEK